MASRGDGVARIYGLTDPRTDQVRYIGKTHQKVGYRLTQHIKSAKDGHNTHLLAWIRSLLAKGIKPGIRILEELAPNADWQAAERKWIAKERAQGWDLTNSTDGGEGMLNPSPEVRQGRSERMRGNHFADGNRNGAGPRSEAFKRRMAEVAKVTRNHTGHRHSAETREIISEKLMGRESLKGERNGQAKLTADQVRRIRAEYAAGGVSQRALAARYGVTRSCVDGILNGRRWQHLER